MQERNGRILDSHRAQALSSLDPTMDEKFVKRYPVESSILYDSVADKYDGGYMWDQKIYRLDQLLVHWGINVSDTQVNEVLLDLYNRNVGTSHQIDTISSYDLSAIRNGQTPETIREIQNLLTPDIHKNSHITEKIHEVEHKHSPLRSVIPLTGYEIEILHQKHLLGGDRISILSALGFKTDNDIGIGGSSGYYEMAHGPFRSYHSTNETFLRFARSGIINMYESYGQSVHLNIDVNRFDGLPELVRLLQTTGWAYHPSKEWNTMSPGLSALFGDENLRIFPKKSTVTGGAYMEAKEFALQDVHGFLKHNKYSSLLATALSAYHRALTYSQPSNLIVVHENKRLLDPEFIVENPHLRAIDKKLALAWFAMAKVIYKGYGNRGMSKFLDMDLNSVANKIFTNEMSAVFGEDYPRWNRHHMKVDSVHTIPVNVYGRKYPNMVSFSRKLATLTGTHISSLLSNYMEEFRSDMKIFKAKGEGFLNSTGYEKFFRKYDCGVRQDLYTVEKRAIFQQIEAQFGKD